MRKKRQPPFAAGAADKPSVDKLPRGRPPKLGARLRAYFLAGILITAPLSITLYLAWLFVSFIDRTVAWVLPPRFNPETYLPFSVPGIGVVVIVATLIAIGWVTAGFVGRFVQRTSESIVFRIPGFRTVYGAIKQILETVLANQSSAFRQAVMVQYPRLGIWTIGFVTGKTEGEIQRLTDGEVVNVFVPTTPNPTSGFLLFVPRRDLMVLSMPVEDAVKMVVSAGIVAPPDHGVAAPPVDGKALPESQVAAAPTAEGSSAASDGPKPPVAETPVGEPPVAEPPVPARPTTAGPTPAGTTHAGPAPPTQHP